LFFCRASLPGDTLCVWVHFLWVHFHQH
jgi:hypothetical protein